MPKPPSSSSKNMITPDDILLYRPPGLLDGIGARNAVMYASPPQRRLHHHHGAPGKATPIPIYRPQAKPRGYPILPLPERRTEERRAPWLADRRWRKICPSSLFRRNILGERRLVSSTLGYAKTLLFELATVTLISIRIQVRATTYDRHQCRQSFSRFYLATS
jgi:hypothetical protein